MNELQEFLVKNTNEKLANFNKKLIFTKFHVYGIPIPQLRRQVKYLHDERGLVFEDIYCLSLEEILAKGIILSYKKEVSEIINKLQTLLPYFDNWCSVDVIIGSLKKLKGDKSAFKFFKECLKSSDEFVVRTGIIGLMKYFIEPQYFNETIKLVNLVNADKYYVKMAKAWAFCEFFIKNFDETIKLFSSIKEFDVKRMTAQKCRDSLRLSKMQKQKITDLLNS